MSTPSQLSLVFVASSTTLTGGVHHWDENGLRHLKNEPADIQKIHREEIAFVKAWLEGWNNKGDEYVLV